MGRAAPRIAHVVQAIEACNEIEACFLNVLGARLLKAYATVHPVRCGMPIRFLHGGRMEIEPDEATVRKSLRH